MNALAQILSSRVRAELFRIMFGITKAELHVRELARRSGLHEATVRQELRKLKGLDLVFERRDGNRVYYRANTHHPLYVDIHQIVIKTIGLVDIFRPKLSHKDIHIAFIFGSITTGKEKSHSDIDLMVIGKIGLRKLISLLSGLSEQVGREINPHVMTESEYSKRVKSKDHFATHVLDGPKLFIVGTENDLETMGK